MLKAPRGRIYYWSLQLFDFSAIKDNGFYCCRISGLPVSTFLAVLPSVLLNYKPATQLQLSSNLFSLGMHISSPMNFFDHLEQLMSTIWVFAACGSGWLIKKMFNPSKWKQNFAETAMTRCTSRRLLYSKDSWKKNNKEIFCFSFCVPALYVFAHRLNHLSKISLPICQTTRLQLETNANDFIQCMLIREKEQCLLICIN